MSDTYNGERVRPEVPALCPKCRHAEFEADLMPEDDNYDETLAAECGVDDNDHDDRFSYIYAFAECGNCGWSCFYGRRWYWNDASGTYDADAPLTPKQQAEQERLAQEAAGQQRMFE